MWANRAISFCSSCISLFRKNVAVFGVRNARIHKGTKRGPESPSYLTDVLYDGAVGIEVVVETVAITETVVVEATEAVEAAEAVQ